MKSPLLLFCMFLMVIVSPCMAKQSKSKSTSEKSAEESVGRVVEGEVVSVSLANRSKRTVSKLSVLVKTSKGSKTYTFVVKSNTTIADAAGNTIGLDEIVASDKVVVSYTIEHSTREAVSINLVSKTE